MKATLKDITVNKLDLTNFLETKEIIKKINPDIIVNTAAISSVDYCEKHRNECEKINVEHVKNLYEISQKHKQFRLYPSISFSGTITILSSIRTELIK